MGRDSMYQVRLKGTYYEMGCQTGKLMKNKRVLPPIWSESFRETISPRRVEFAEKCEEVVRRYMPDFLDELQGIAAATGEDYDRVKISPLCSYGGLSQPACSAVAISGQHTLKEQPLFIRHYDYLDTDRKDFTAFWTEPKTGYASVGFSDSMSSRYCGFNEKGLTIAASISGYAGQPEPGAAFSLVTRWILDQYATTDEATDFLKRVSHFHGWNFLLCDSQNHIIRVETCPKKVATVSFDEGIGVSTNHYLSREMQRFEEETWRSEGSTQQRYDNMLNWFHNRDGPITTEYAHRLASQRVDEGGLCDRFIGVDGGTLWSWIHVTGEATVLVCDGPPSENNYQQLPAL